MKLNYGLLNCRYGDCGLGFGISVGRTLGVRPYASAINRWKIPIPR